MTDLIELWFAHHCVELLVIGTLYLCVSVILFLIMGFTTRSPEAFIETLNVCGRGLMYFLLAPAVIFSLIVQAGMKIAIFCWIFLFVKR